MQTIQKTDFIITICSYSVVETLSVPQIQWFQTIPDHLRSLFLLQSVEGKSVVIIIIAAAVIIVINFGNMKWTWNCEKG